MSKSSLFLISILLSHPVFAGDEFCGNPTPDMQVCVESNASSGRYQITWADPSENHDPLPVLERVVSPLDGAITYSGYINWRYPFESYTLVLKLNEADGQGIPAVFTYARTLERSEIYTFEMNKKGSP